MQITSFVFLIYIFIGLIVYYIVPKKRQWVVLLCMSLLFYISCNVWNVFYVVMTTTTVYIATCRMNSIVEKQKMSFKENTLSKDEKLIIKKNNKKKKQRILIFTLIINFGVLCTFKYYHFTIEQINSLISCFGGNLLADNFHFLIPLGISFYTFQAMGYLIDVYWGNCVVEKNYLKVLLFVSFFPQVTQGPISEYGQLSKELFSEKDFLYENYFRGFQRLIWGIFKKMVVADGLAPMVSELFKNYTSYIGIACLLGAVGYSIQIYADFSGYMDIMCGICKMFGVSLTENFERPYFSKSIAEYWRRWHISLGAWFKKYIYYPIGVAKWNQKIGKYFQRKFGRHVGQTIPASIALVVVWFTTGLWHGASWAYISWGLVNGIFIIFSLWMEPIYLSIKEKLGINDNSFIWRVFQVSRTFILVTFIKILPEVGTLADGLGLWKRIFTEYTIPTTFNELFPFVNDKLTFCVISFGTFLIFIHSMLQRKRENVRLFYKMPQIIQITSMVVLSLIVLIFGVANNDVGGFMYAQF